MSVNHNYFEASHGKSSADGLGAITKHAAALAVTRSQYVIRNPHEFYEFCTNELTNVGNSVFPSQAQKYECSSRTFFYCEKANRNRPDRVVKTVKGMMKVHCVHGMSEPYHIQTRELSCTCDFCWSSIGHECQEKDLVGPWTDVVLELANPGEAEQINPDAKEASAHPVSLCSDIAAGILFVCFLLYLYRQQVTFIAI